MLINLSESDPKKVYKINNVTERVFMNRQFITEYFTYYKRSIELLHAGRFKTFTLD